MPDYDTLWINAHLAPMTGGTGAGADAFTTIRNGAIAARGGAIAWIGREADLPAPPERLATTVIDARGAWITPGLVDPHTHLVFGGDRIRDFERRIAGESYRDATGAEKGIAHTVAVTRAASDRELTGNARARLVALVANGATTVEIKSGYGLDLETEVRLLRIARALGHELGISVRTTYLGAHVVPPEYADRRDAYLALVCDVVLPRIAAEGLADAVDVFCDAIAFSPSEAERVFEAPRKPACP